MKARKGSHSVFSIHLHFVLVTKYRRKSINAAILQRVQKVFVHVCNKTGCKMIESSGEVDHVHLLVDFHPRNSVSTFIGSIKSASSRIVRKEFAEHLKQFYKGECPSFWSGSYYVCSAGGAPIQKIQEYIKSQEAPTE